MNTYLPRLLIERFVPNRRKWQIYTGFPTMYCLCLSLGCCQWMPMLPVLFLLSVCSGQWQITSSFIATEGQKWLPPPLPLPPVSKKRWNVLTWKLPFMLPGAPDYLLFSPPHLVKKTKNTPSILCPPYLF